MEKMGKNRRILTVVCAVLVLAAVGGIVGLLCLFGDYSWSKSHRSAAQTTAEATTEPEITEDPGPALRSETGIVSTAAPGTSSRPAVTTKPERNIDDVTTPARTAAHVTTEEATTAGQGTSAPVDRTSVGTETTHSPEERTESPEERTSGQMTTTRVPATTRVPYVTTRSPEVTTVPHSQYTPDPAITIIPPVTMPDGNVMMNGDRFDDVLKAPSGEEISGHWEMSWEDIAYFIADVPTLAEYETWRGWAWDSDYHILVSGTYEGIGMGYCDFTPDVWLPPIPGTVYTQDTAVYSVESGSWW